MSKRPSARRMGEGEYEQWAPGLRNVVNGLKVCFAPVHGTVSVKTAGGTKCTSSRNKPAATCMI